MQLQSQILDQTLQKALQTRSQKLKQHLRMVLYTYLIHPSTVNGKQITEDDAKVDLSYVDYSTNTVVYKGDTKTALVTDDDGNSYFEESVLRAAPYFTLRIDGITELNAN